MTTPSQRPVRYLRLERIERVICADGAWRCRAGLPEVVAVVVTAPAAAAAAATDVRAAAPSAPARAGPKC